MYSKVAFAPLWVEILSNILPHLKANVTDTYYDFDGIKHNTPPPKLSLFSAHDDTIIPLLASLGDEVFDGSTWAPYASIMLIEIHEITINPSTPMYEHLNSVYPSRRAFRLIYNGKVLTKKLTGCDSELCDIGVLLDRVLPFASNDRDCNLSATTDPPTEPPSTTTTFNEAIMTIFSTIRGFILFLFIVAISGCIGGIITYIMMTGRFPNFCPCCNRRDRLDQRDYSTPNLRFTNEIDEDSP